MTTRLVTFRAEGLPELTDCSSQVHGLASSAEDLRAWHDALDEPAVSATYFRARREIRAVVAVGDVAAVHVEVTGTLLDGTTRGTACSVTLTWYVDEARAMSGLLDLEQPETVHQDLNAADVWAALGVQEVAAP